MTIRKKTYEKDMKEFNPAEPTYIENPEKRASKNVSLYILDPRLDKQIEFFVAECQYILNK